MGKEIRTRAIKHKKAERENITPNFVILNMRDKKVYIVADEFAVARYTNQDAEIINRKLKNGEGMYFYRDWIVTTNIYLIKRVLSEKYKKKLRETWQDYTGQKLDKDE